MHRGLGTRRQPDPGGMGTRGQPHPGGMGTRGAWSVMTFTLGDEGMADVGADTRQEVRVVQR